jgi:hypothetical protein
MHMNACFTDHLNEPRTALTNQTSRKPILVLYDFKYHLHCINHDLKICTVMTSLPLVDICEAHFFLIFSHPPMKGEANKAWATTTLSLHHCCSKCRLSPFVHHLYTSAAVSTERKQDISQPPSHLKCRSLQEWTTEQVQKISHTITWHKEIPRYWKLLRVHDVILRGKYLIPNGYVPFVRSYLSTRTDGSLNRCINLADIRIRISLNAFVKTAFNVIKLTTLTRKQKKNFYL